MKAMGIEEIDFQKIPADLMVDWKTVSFPPDDSPSVIRAKFDSALNKFLRSSSIETLNIQMVISILEHLRNRRRISKTSSSPATILCLGLGNPALYTSSLNQLALLAALVKLSGGTFLSEKTFIYDPLMKKVARNFIRGLGFRVSYYFLSIYYLCFYLFVKELRSKVSEVFRQNMSLLDHIVLYYPNYIYLDRQHIRDKGKLIISSIILIRSKAKIQILIMGNY